MTIRLSTATCKCNAVGGEVFTLNTPAEKESLSIGLFLLKSLQRSIKSDQPSLVPASEFGPAAEVVPAAELIAAVHPAVECM